MDARAADGPPRIVDFMDRGPYSHVWSLALAADGKTAYAGFAGVWGEIAVVDCESAREVATLRSDKVVSGVRSLPLLESSGGGGGSAGARLFAGHVNGVISEWDLESRACSTVYGDPRSRSGYVQCIAARFTEQGSDGGDAVALAEAARGGATVTRAGAATGDGRDGDRAGCGAAQRGVEFAAAHASGVVRVWRASSSCASGKNAALKRSAAGGTADAAPARATWGELRKAGNAVKPAPAASAVTPERHVSAGGASGDNSAPMTSAAGGTADAAPARAASGELRKAGDRAQPAAAASAVTPEEHFSAGCAFDDNSALKRSAAGGTVDAAPARATSGELRKACDGVHSAAAVSVLAPENHDSAARARLLAEDTAPAAVVTINATALGRKSLEPENNGRSYEVYGDGGGATAVAYVEVEDESVLFAGGDDGTVRLLDARMPGKAVRELTGHGDYVGAVASVGRGAGCAGGKIVAASCSEDGTARLWGYENEEADSEVRSLLTLESSNGESLYCLDVTPDAERIVAGGTDSSDEYCVYVWTRRRSAGTAAATLTADAYEAIALPGHNDVVSAVQVSRTGERIVSSSGDGTMRIWRVAKGVTTARDIDAPREVVFVARDKSSSVSSLALSADAQTVYAGMWDHSEIALVDCESAREVASLRSDRVEGGVRCLKLLDSCAGGGSSAGGRLFAGHENGVISEWDLESRKCLTLYYDSRSGAEDVWSITARFTGQSSDAGDAVTCGTGADDGPRVTEADSGTRNGRDGDHAVTGARKSVVEFAARYAGGMVRKWRSSHSYKSVENSAPMLSIESATGEVVAGVERTLESASSGDLHQNANEGGKLSCAFDFGVLHESIDDAGNAGVDSGGSMAVWSCCDTSGSGTPAPLETETLAVPKACLDLTTGRGGVNIRVLHECSGAHNQVAHELPGSLTSPSRPVTLYGSLAGIDAVKNIIFDMLTEFQSACPTARHGPILALALRGSGEGSPKNKDMVRERPAFWCVVDHVETLAKELELRWAYGKFFEWWRFGFFDCNVPLEVPWRISFPDSRRVWFESARSPDGCSASAATAERNSSECGPPPILPLDNGHCDGDAVQPQGSASGSGAQGSSSGHGQIDNAAEDGSEGPYSGTGSNDGATLSGKPRAVYERKYKKARLAKIKKDYKDGTDRVSYPAHLKKERERKRRKREQVQARGRKRGRKSSGEREKEPPDRMDPNPHVHPPGSLSHISCACVAQKEQQPSEWIGETGAPGGLDSNVAQTPEQRRIMELERMLSRTVKERSLAERKCSHLTIDRDRWMNKCIDTEHELETTQKKLADTVEERAVIEARLPSSAPGTTYLQSSLNQNQDRMLSRALKECSLVERKCSHLTIDRDRWMNKYVDTEHELETTQKKLADTVEERVAIEAPMPSSARGTYPQSSLNQNQGYARVGAERPSPHAPDENRSQAHDPQRDLSAFAVNRATVAPCRVRDLGGPNCTAPSSLDLSPTALAASQKNGEFVAGIEESPSAAGYSVAANEALIDQFLNNEPHAPRGGEKSGHGGTTEGSRHLRSFQNVTLARPTDPPPENPATNQNSEAGAANEALLPESGNFLPHSSIDGSFYLCRRTAVVGPDDPGDDTEIPSGDGNDDLESLHDIKDLDIADMPRIFP